MNNKRRGRKNSALSHTTIAEKIGVSQQRVTAMLRNLDQGKNRERLTAALIACHLTPEGVEIFLEQYKNSEK
jgi:DNA-binding XRE family transcriptional regulator